MVHYKRGELFVWDTSAAHPGLGRSPMIGFRLFNLGGLPSMWDPMVGRVSVPITVHKASLLSSG